MSGVERLIYLLAAIRSREDLLIRPFFNQPVAFELTQVGGELITHCLISLCIGEENDDASLLLLLLHALVPPILLIIPCVLSMVHRQRLKVATSTRHIS